MDFVLDKYWISNELRMFLEIQKKKLKFKNFNLNFSAINSEDLDAEGEMFSLNFEMLLNSKEKFLSNLVFVIYFENDKITLKFKRKRRVRNKKKEVESLEELFEFLNEIIFHLKKQLKLLDAFFIYFKDQPEFYDFCFEYDNKKEKIAINLGSYPKKKKIIKGKKYIGILELYFFYEINQFIIHQEFFGPKGYKFYQELTCNISDENKAVKDFAEKWKEAIYIAKEKIEDFELKYKKQKFLIKKL